MTRVSRQSFVAEDGARLHYRESRPDGAGARPPVVLLHSLFFDGDMFDEVIARLPDDVRTIVPDHRGQGRSESGGTAPSIERLAKDTSILIETAVGGPVHLVGSSMGGYVALAIAAANAGLLHSCVLSCCTAHAEQDPERFAKLESELRDRGPAALVDTLMKTMFGEHFLTHGDTDALHRWRTRFSGLDRSIADAVHGVFSRPSYASMLAGLKVPLLLCSGELDRAKRPADMAFIAGQVPGSRHVVFPESGHTPPIEAPAEFAEELIRFWRATGSQAPTNPVIDGESAGDTDRISLS